MSMAEVKTPVFCIIKCWIWTTSLMTYLIAGAQSYVTWTFKTLMLNRLKQMIHPDDSGSSNHFRALRDIVRALTVEEGTTPRFLYQLCEDLCPSSSTVSRHLLCPSKSLLGCPGMLRGRNTLFATSSPRPSGA